MPAPTVRELIAALERWFEPAWAEPWDNVGLVLGDSARSAGGVHIAVDPTSAVAAEAVTLGAGLLITHHPLWLGGIRDMAGDKGHTYRTLEAGGCALYVAHTNADRAQPGVSDALGKLLELTGLRPLALPPAPRRQGEASPGHPPCAGEPARPGFGLGRVGELAEPMSLRAFVDRVARMLPATAAGIRASGNPDRAVRTVAVAGGSCLDLADEAAAAGADVLVTSDAKHHRAQEAPLAVVDIAHWAGEWPWTVALGERLRKSFPALMVTVSGLVTDPWTMVAGVAGATV